LEAKGWKVGTVKQFLGLSDEEAAYIELKVKLAAGLRRRRQQKLLSQLDLATKLQSSQSRVAKWKQATHPCSPEEGDRFSKRICPHLKEGEPQYSLCPFIISNAICPYRRSCIYPDERSHLALYDALTASSMHTPVANSECPYVP
jgi:hypothetical protein